MKTKSYISLCLLNECAACKKSIFTISILVLGYFIQAQTTPAWINFYSASDYQNYDVQEAAVGLDSVGNIYTAASMHDTVANQDNMLLVKYNSAGLQQWAKTYSNSSDDKHVAILLVDKAGNCYVCGYGYMTGASTSKDYVVAKYDNAGNQQWVKNWDGGSNAWDYITCATFDAAGNIIVAGYCNDNGGPNGDDIGVVKYSTAGTQLWSYVYNNPVSNDEDQAFGVASDGSSNIFITGSTYQTNARNMITLKLNSGGVSQWTKIAPHVTSGSDEYSYSVAADANGDSYITGFSGDWITVKYDPSGTVLWTNHYTLNSHFSRTKKVLLDRHNNVLVTGDAFTGSASSGDLVAFKLNGATGASSWAMSFDNNNGSDYFTDAVLDTSGNVYLCGYFTGSDGIDMSALTVSSAGSAIWHTTYTNPFYPSGTDEAYHLVVDKNRNVILSGVAERRGGTTVDRVDIVTLKYSALVTGIKENTLDHIDMTIYPNPTKENLTVSFTEQSLLGSRLSISSMIGETVKEETLTTLTQQIDLGSLSKGIYIIKVSNERSVATGKLIIE